MDWIIKPKFAIPGEWFIHLPPEISTIFTLVVIFGLVWIFFRFIFKFWKYYQEVMRPRQEERQRQIAIRAAEEEKAKHEETKKDDSYDRILDLHEKLGNLTSDYAGKYATREELKDVRDKVDKTREDVSNMKGQLGI